MDYTGARKYILSKLKKELPGNLTYHGIHHTKDVLKAAELLAKNEGVNSDDLILLKTATLYHDSGFIKKYRNHEETGCEIVDSQLPKFGYNKESIKKIKGMIMATKIPQSPKNHLEEIICDADLDYLGRDDFWPISNSLFKEFIVYDIVDNEIDWNILQLKFLESHHYFTKTAKKLRKKKKFEHLKKIKEIVNGY